MKKYEAKSFFGDRNICIVNKHYINDGKGTIIARNENVEFETASTIKMFILATLFDEVENGTKSLSDVLTYSKNHEIDGSGILKSMEEGTLISEEASLQMLEICKMQHYNSMLTKSFPQYFMDSDNYEEEIIYAASKSGSMDECRNDGGIVSTLYGKYVIVLLNKDFKDKMYYEEHPATVFGAKVSRLIFDQYLTLEGALKKYN
ncbi:MAG: serine hydrolase [Lachnotalea sp.]